jgi:hypothetical protein
VLTRHALSGRADADGVDAAVVERDYVLTHVAQLHRAPGSETGARMLGWFSRAARLSASSTFHDYRYSADLDFTVIHGSAEEAGHALAEGAATLSRRDEQSRFRRDEVVHRRDQLRDILDEAAVLLAKGPTNLRRLR